MNSIEIVFDKSKILNPLQVAFKSQGLVIFIIGLCIKKFGFMVLISDKAQFLCSFLFVCYKIVSIHKFSVLDIK